MKVHKRGVKKQVKGGRVKVEERRCELARCQAVRRSRGEQEEIDNSVEEPWLAWLAAVITEGRVDVAPPMAWQMMWHSR